MTCQVPIAQYVTKNSIIRHLLHHHGISQYFQCQSKVCLGWDALYLNFGASSHYMLLVDFLQQLFFLPEFFKRAEHTLVIKK